MNDSTYSRMPISVRIARGIRHAPGLSSFESLWKFVRPVYQKFLNTLSGNRGFALSIKNVGEIHVPVSFLSDDIDSLEIPMLKKFAPSCIDGICLYDVGASFGMHSLVAGERMSEEAEIHAFEPELISCAKYWANTELLRRRFNVYLSRCFVSDTSNTSDKTKLSPVEMLAKSPKLKKKVGHHLYLFDPARDKQIPQISLDDYVHSGARPPNVIKCDIEGAELLLLKGASETLRKYHPTLFISLHPKLIGNFNYTESDFFNFLRSHQYEWEILNEIGETHVCARPAVSPDKQ